MHQPPRMAGSRFNFLGHLPDSRDHRPRFRDTQTPEILPLPLQVCRRGLSWTRSAA